MTSFIDTLHVYHRCCCWKSERGCSCTHARHKSGRHDDEPRTVGTDEKKGYVTKIYIIVLSWILFFMWVPSIKRNLTFVQLVVTSVVCSDSVAPTAFL